MTLVSSGEISIGGTDTDRSINLELGRAAGATSNLNETDLRSLAGITTPATDTIGSFGSSPNPALNTLHQLNTTRSWRIAVSSTGGAGVIDWLVENATLSIRNASSTVLASRTLRMYVEANSINL